MAKGQNLHLVMEMPWTPPENAARLRRTSALAAELIAAPESDCCAATEASLAVHFIADYLHEPDGLGAAQSEPTPWERLDVDAWLDFLVRHDVASQFDVDGILHSATCFHRFLAARGLLSHDIADARIAAIGARRDAFLESLPGRRPRMSRRERRAMASQQRRLISKLRN